MTIATPFEDALTAAERRTLATLTTPAAIQNVLDGLSYSADPFYRAPLRALREGVAHCFDGALFAAALFRRIGLPPLILEMLPNDRDDDHLLAVFNINGCWGAVAKSNFVGLRYREPVYRTLRELVMSYFEQYYNVAGEKTLRGYTLPLNLSAFDRHNWMCRDEPLDAVADRLDRTRRVTLLTPAMVELLTLVDERSRQAGLLDSRPEGLYRIDT